MSNDTKTASAPRAFGADWSAEPLPSVRFGRRITLAPWPRQLEWLRASIKKLAWTAVEARHVTTPVRYAVHELATGGQGVYALRDGSSRFVVRHRSGDIEIFRKFYGYGYYRLPDEVASRLRSLGRPVNVLDLGANVGFFEVFTRDRLPIGQVVCLEPDPYNAAVLEQVRAENGAGWQIVRACASNKDDTVQFNTGRKNLSRVGSAGDITIASKDVFPLIADADLVKMNIEGSEWEVLRDPRLATTSVSWIVEYHRIANPEPDIHALARALFERAGYTVRQAQEGDANGLLWAWKA